MCENVCRSENWEDLVNDVINWEDWTQSRYDDLIGKIQALLKSFEEVEDGDGKGSFPFELSGVGNVLKASIDQLRRPSSEVLFVSFLEHFLL